MEANGLRVLFKKFLSRMGLLYFSGISYRADEAHNIFAL